MKNIFLVCFSVVCLSLSGLWAQESVKQNASQTVPQEIQDQIHWISFEKALEINSYLAQNGQASRKIFIDIYTDWCGWCKKLDVSTFAHPEIVRYMKNNFLTVKLDAERKDTVIINGQSFVNPNPNGKRSTHELASVLLKGKMSYPSCTFIDEKGLQLDVIPGYMSAPDFEKLLHFFGEDAYKETSWEEFQKNFNGKIKE